jgi:hypothetical protein
MKGYYYSHNLTEAKRAITPALYRGRSEQMLSEERLKALAEIVNIAEKQ